MSDLRPEKVVITSLGSNRPGIVAGISALLARHKVDIQDISQTIMGELYVLAMMVDIRTADIDFRFLKEKLDNLSVELQVQILTQTEETFKFMHRV